MDTQELIAARQDTHGDYVTTAAFAQQIKALFRGYAGKMSADQRESLDMIATKVARILSGNPNDIDHWADIAGYAQLIVNRLSRK